MNILKNALLLMVALLWVSSAHASVNLVFNGDFETVDGTTSIGGYSGELQNLPSGKWAIYGSLPSWSSDAAGAGIEVHNGQVVPNLVNPASNHYVELDTTRNSNMFQDIRGMQVGQSYTLTFDYFNRTNDASSTINYSLGDFSGIADFATMAWVTISHTFAFNGDAVLRFIADGNSNGFGGFIDNVSLTSAVPLPGAAILFGSGLLGLVGLRRRQIV